MLIRKSLSGLWKKRHIANVLFCWRKRPKRRFRPEIYKRCLYFEHIECILVGNNCNDDETSRSKWFFWGYLTPKMRLISAYCASKPILLIQRALEKLSSTKNISLILNLSDFKRFWHRKSPFKLSFLSKIRVFEPKTDSIMGSLPLFHSSSFFNKKFSDFWNFWTKKRAKVSKIFRKFQNNDFC